MSNPEYRQPGCDERSLGCGRRDFLAWSVLASASAAVACRKGPEVPLACATSLPVDEIDQWRRATGSGFTIHVAGAGGFAIRLGPDSYFVDSCFSRPATRVTWQSLAAMSVGSDVVVESAGAARWRIRHEGATYRISRTIAVEGHRCSVTDLIENKGAEDVAVDIVHLFRSDAVTRLLLAGAPEDSEVGTQGRTRVKQALRAFGLRPHALVTHVAENPTVHLSGARSGLGAVCEDSVSRLKCELFAEANGAALRLTHLALGAGEQRTLRWAVYPLASGEGYDTFINRVRENWAVNTTVAGPWSFFNLIAHADLLRDVGALGAFIARQNLHTVAFTPWLDYDNYDWRRKRFVSRDEYRALTQSALAAFGRAAPSVKCTGCMQSNLVSPPPDVGRELYQALPAAARRPGFARFTDMQMKILTRATLPFRDSLLVDRDGRHTYELYESGPERKPSIAVAVYARSGNWQAQNWLDQARFLLDDVGLDGIYIDQFNLAFRAEPDERFSYDRWDGVTVDSDPLSGQIVRRYTDGALVGIEAQRRLAEYVLGKGAVMVANTTSAAEEHQRLPVMRFLEGSTLVDALKIMPGQRPPRSRWLAKGQLGTPIALGVERAAWDRTAVLPETVMQCVITYLRHGLLYYHINARIGDEMDGPIPYLFPLTPVAIHEGWIDGLERTVTAVSGQFARRQSARPLVRCFDERGKTVPVNAEITGAEGDWFVTLRLRDWAEVSVVT